MVLPGLQNTINTGCPRHQGKRELTLDETTLFELVRNLIEIGAARNDDYSGLGITGKADGKEEIAHHQGEHEQGHDPG